MDFTVLTQEQQERQRKLEEFYREIQNLACTSKLNQYPLVYEALTRVDRDWNLHAKFYT